MEAHEEASPYSALKGKVESPTGAHVGTSPSRGKLKNHEWCTWELPKHCMSTLQRRSTNHGSTVRRLQWLHYGSTVRRLQWLHYGSTVWRLQWLHYACEQLSADAVTFYEDTNTLYVCVACKSLKEPHKENIARHKRYNPLCTMSDPVQLGYLQTLPISQLMHEDSPNTNLDLIELPLLINTSWKLKCLSETPISQLLCHTIMPHYILQTCLLWKNIIIHQMPVKCYQIAAMDNI